MPRYSYVALNQQHQKLTGVLSADNEQNAREKLHAMAFSVIVLKKEADADYQESAEEGVATFAFFARDIRGKEAKGTIDAPDRKTAFRRLVAEYNFEIISLIEATVPESERFEKGKAGLEELAEDVEEEFGVSFKTPSESGEEEPAEGRTLSESFLERKKELIENAEEIVKQAREVIERFTDEMTGDEVHAIKKRVDDLMRMRLSNNLKYIQDLADELLALVDDTLRHHAEEEEEAEEEAEEIAEEIVDETAYKNAIKEQGIVSQVKNISKIFRRVVRDYRRKYERKKRKKLRKRNPVLARVQLCTRLINRSVAHILRALFAKNSAVRRQHFQQVQENFSSLQVIFKQSTEEVLRAQAELDATDQEEENGDEEKLSEELSEKLFGWLEEAHLFCGWFLSFYVFYFYFGIFIIVKGVNGFPLSSFVERSLTNSFPFIITGIFFLLFLGDTLTLRFARKRRRWMAPIFIGGSAFLSFVFVLNF